MPQGGARKRMQHLLYQCVETLVVINMRGIPLMYIWMNKKLGQDQKIGFYELGVVCHDVNEVIQNATSDRKISKDLS